MHTRKRLFTVVVQRIVSNSDARDSHAIYPCCEWIGNAICLFDKRFVSHI